MIQPASRTASHTSHEVNRRLWHVTEASIAHYGHRTDRIDNRLSELDGEWDIERVLQANAASLILFGLVRATARRRWLLFPLLVAGFLLQHAIQGWCPPVPILRRLGIRTAQKIEAERYALKALRGDFQNMPNQPPRRAAEATGRLSGEAIEN